MIWDGVGENICVKSVETFLHSQSILVYINKEDRQGKW